MKASPARTPASSQAEEQLRPPPSMQWETAVLPMSESLPKPKLSTSLSMKLPDKLSKMWQSKKGQRRQKSAEESVWMKTILLGEKCKAKSDEEEEEEEEEKAARAINHRARPTSPLMVPTSNPRRKLLTSLSMKLPDKLTSIRGAKKERKEESADESIWTERLKALRDAGREEEQEPGEVVADSAATRDPISSTASKSALRRKFSVSYTISKLFKSPMTRKEREEEKPAEESIWRKKIIMGGRCQVPRDDEELAVNDRKGKNKERSFRPGSLPGSRSNSFLNNDVAR